ncbi:IS3 family transposase IS629 [Sodalis praecaptivus]
MEQHGVEPVCHELHIAPATYYWQQKRQQNLELRSVRQRRDEELGREIERVYDENKRLYGVKKVWLQLRCEGVKVARCTVERLMRARGRVGIRRGKGVKTTCSDKDAATPDDLVNRRFMAERPNQLWVADFTYVSTAQGFVYVAFIVDVFAGVIVGWRVSTSMETSLVLDALEQALWARLPGKGVIHHSDRGSQSCFISVFKAPEGC